MRTRRAPSPRARKAPAGVAALLPKMRAGRITADTFFRETSTDFLRMGAKLMRSYDLPPSVDLEDVAQELRLRELEAVPNWDCTAGKGLADFCTFVAHSKTRKMLDRARGADRRTKQSRMPLLLIDAVEAEEREALYGRGRESDPTPEEVAAAQGRVELARKIAAAVGMTVDDLLEEIDRDDVRDRVRSFVVGSVFAGEAESEVGAKFEEEWSW